MVTGENLFSMQDARNLIRLPHGDHQMSLVIAAGLGLGGNESCPDLFQPHGGFPDGVKVDNSYVALPELPGIGFEGNADLYREMKALAG